MRIRHFSKNVEVNELQDFNLKNCKVVIDGQNYFYNLYMKFGLPFVFGCEADKYAKLLRQHLAMFKEANVTCYVLLKGGHESSHIAIKDKRYYGRDFELGEPVIHEIVQPIFMKSIYKQVLRELDINYVVCEFESKQQCIAMAQTLKCPIISFDIEFCFSGIPYIPSTTLLYDEVRKSIKCSVFDYEKFKSKHRLTDEQVAIFIALTDEKIYTFPENTFEQLFRNLRFPYSPFKRNAFLLQWIGSTRLQHVYNAINRFLTGEMERQFQEEVQRIMAFICKVEEPGIPVKYLLNGNQLTFRDNDPDWFEKGVAIGNIAIKYINMYHWNLWMGSWSIEDVAADDAMLLSLDIIAYAFNLMTNYQRKELIFYNNNGEVENKDVSESNVAIISKPLFEAQVVPFENGWEHVRSMELFEHFLTQSFKGIDLEPLQSVPEDAQLLMIALAYFSRQKGDSTTREVLSVLLSYVMLSVVQDKVADSDNNSLMNRRPILDPNTDKNHVKVPDCNVTARILRKFFELKTPELHSIFDRKLMHSLVEFQHCLDQFNHLNHLCGKPFKPTQYDKTYNGTFVYKFFYSLKDISDDRVISYVEDKLCPAPTVLAFLTGLLNVYEQIII